MPLCLLSLTTQTWAVNITRRVCQISDAPGMLTRWCWISQLLLLPLRLNQLQFLSVQRSTIDEMWLPDPLFTLYASECYTSEWSEGLSRTVKELENSLLTRHKRQAVRESALTLKTPRAICFVPDRLYHDTSIPMLSALLFFKYCNSIILIIVILFLFLKKNKI